jgi:hypothetical protein
MIFIKYNSEGHQDGLGAQLQRQIATFCLSKFLRVKFVPSSITSLDFNPGDGITNGEEQALLLAKVNLELHRNLPKTRKLLNPVEIRDLNAPTKLWKLQIWFLVVILKNYFKKSGLLIHIDDPYVYINQNPNVYKHAKNFLFPIHNPYSKTREYLDVALHIPRAKVSSNQLPERYQPTHWYVRTLDEILTYLGVGKASVRLYIHTDAPTKPTKWTYSSKSSKVSQEYWDAAGLLDEDGNMSLNYEDFQLSFLEYPNIEVIREVSPLEAWGNICSSDLFILGKSSFSFIGALFNQNGLKVSPKFFIQPPNNWLKVSDDCTMSIQSKLRIALFRFKLSKRLRLINSEK